MKSNLNAFSSFEIQEKVLKSNIGVEDEALTFCWKWFLLEKFTKGYENEC